MTTNQIARLRWACRRGMLELDLLLQPFLEQQFVSLSPQQQHDFTTLLECTDQELYSWLLGTEEPSQIAWQELIARIRAQG